MLEKWANRNLMELNKGKHNVLHRVSCCRHQFILGIPDQKAAGSQGSGWQNLTTSQQHTLVVKKTNTILDFQTATSRSSEVILPLYSVLVRPHLEYQVQVWATQFIRDMNLLGQVQNKVTKVCIFHMQQSERPRITWRSPG